jgi:spermidine synthase
MAIELDGPHMKPRELVGTAKVPGGAELRLIRHDGDHVIMVGANELMNSRLGGSEEALAVMTCERLRERAKPHLLVGGYGMGFTLRAALAILGAHARVTVAELVPEIIDWARGPMATLTAGCLDDPRVDLVAGDVAAAIGAGVNAGTGRYDAVLLDVDNGPSGLTRAANDGLYSKRGLATAKAALRPGGILAIWSAAPDAAFTRRLSDCGFKVEEVTVRARSNGKGPRHTIWFAGSR